MDGVADVVVADGFTGNAVLKSIEGTAISILGQLKKAVLGGGLKAKLGALLPQRQPTGNAQESGLFQCRWGRSLWSQGASGQDTRFK